MANNRDLQQMEVVNQVKDVGKGNAVYLENNAQRGKNWDMAEKQEVIRRVFLNHENSGIRFQP